jgi:hypothetical protein
MSHLFDLDITEIIIIIFEKLEVFGGKIIIFK